MAAKSTPKVAKRSRRRFTPSRVPIVLLLTTFETERDARRVGRSLVEERLAVCVTVVPRAHSIYPWNGAIQGSGETLALIKSNARRTGALLSRLAELHPYDTPEMLQIRADIRNPAYAKWLGAWLNA